MKEELLWEREWSAEFPLTTLQSRGCSRGILHMGFAFGKWSPNCWLQYSAFWSLLPGWNLMWGKQALTQLGWVNTVTWSHSFLWQVAASSPALGSRGAVHALPKGDAECDTPRRSLSLSINYRGSPRKLYPQLNLVIVNPLPTFEYASYQAALAAGND